MLDGPRLPPSSGKAGSLVVLLHGYGADGDDLIALGSEWRQLLPDAAFVAPHAAAMIPGFPPGMSGGRQWFALDQYDPNLLRRDPQQAVGVYATMQAGAEQVMPVLQSFLDVELAKHKLDGSRLALVGFSQGTMMALHAGLRRSPGPAAILGYSGAMLGADALKTQIKSRPPIFLIHGDADDIVPIEAMFAAINGLNDAGCPARWHVSRSVAHGIAPDGLELGGAFLAESLAR